MRRVAIMLITASAVLLSATAARADAAADTAKAQAMLTEQAAKLEAETEIHRRTKERVERAILSAPYIEQYQRECFERRKRLRIIGGCDEEEIRWKLHEQRPFRPVYEALYKEFLPEEANRYAAER